MKSGGHQRSRIVPPGDRGPWPGDAHGIHANVKAMTIATSMNHLNDPGNRFLFKILSLLV